MDYQYDKREGQTYKEHQNEILSRIRNAKSDITDETENQIDQLHSEWTAQCKKDEEETLEKNKKYLEERIKELVQIERKKQDEKLNSIQREIKSMSSDIQYVIKANEKKIEEIIMGYKKDKEKIMKELEEEKKNIKELELKLKEDKIKDHKDIMDVMQSEFVENLNVLYRAAENLYPQIADGITR